MKTKCDSTEPIDDRFGAIKDAECRVCGSKRMQLLGTCREIGESSILLFPHGLVPEHARGELYRCPDCGLGQRIPCLSERELKVIYESMEENQMSYEFESNGAWIKARALLKQNWKDTDAPCILDIGTYEGRFLQGLPKEWLKFAIEPSQKAQAVLGENGIEVIGDFLENTPSQWHGKFDSVCMFDVLEHLHNPSGGLLRALQFVKPGGRILISTGNMDAFIWKWLGPDHWYLESPLHLSFGSEKFFRFFCHKSRITLSGSYRIAHRINSTRQKIDDYVTSCYFIFKKKGKAWRIPQRIIQAIPRYNYLMHKHEIPCMFHLKDHVIVELRKED